MILNLSFDPSFHNKIDALLDTYSKKLAANMNNGFAIDARVPSVLIAGGSNFPTRKKEKQNAARDKNYREWKEIQGLLEKIRSTRMGGIFIGACRAPLMQTLRYSCPERCVALLVGSAV